MKGKYSKSLMAGMLFAGMLAGCASKETDPQDWLSKTETVLQLGSSKEDLDPESFFKTDVLEEISGAALVFETDSLDQVGEYAASLTFEKADEEYSVPVTVHVKDTVKPELYGTDEAITLGTGSSLEDLKSALSARVSDYSQFTISFDEDIDFSTPSEKDLFVTVQDASGNKNSANYRLVITDASDSVLQEQTQQEDSSEAAASSEISSAADSDSSSTEMFYKDGILIVNKVYSLPADYAPGEDAAAGAQVRQLIADMQSLGYDVSNSYSGFRTYDTQYSLYWGYVSSSGQAAADTFSARPGFSEHQTGLVFDLKHSDGSLITGTAEASWIEQNCAKYGFIVRYKTGWESVTGYTAEPWHLRYVGDIAQDVMDSGLPLETYLGVEGGDYR